jgi:hypothetical protein
VLQIRISVTISRHISQEFNIAPPCEGIGSKRNAMSDHAVKDYSGISEIAPNIFYFSVLEFWVVGLRSRTLYPNTHWKNGWLKQQGNIGKLHDVFKWRPLSYHGNFFRIKPWISPAKYLTFSCDKRDGSKWFLHSSVTSYWLLFCKLFCTIYRSCLKSSRLTDRLSRNVDN